MFLSIKVYKLFENTFFEVSTVVLLVIFNVPLEVVSSLSKYTIIDQESQFAGPILHYLRNPTVTILSLATEKVYRNVKYMLVKHTRVKMSTTNTQCA